MFSRLSLALLFAVVAHGAAAQAQKGANGGDVVVVEGHPIEFVNKGQQIIFFILEDDGKTLTQTKGATGRAVVQDGGKTTAVALAPEEPNKLVGQLAMPLGSKARVVLSAKVADHTLQARFTTN
jgi:hypothetical protein